MMTEETIQLLAWLGIAVFLGILEAVTVALISLWFAIGALAAMIPAYFGAPLWVQILVFLVVSAVCLAFTRTFFKDVVKTKKQPTNSDRLIGSDGVVSSKIDNLQGTGKVYISGLTWSARTIDGSEAEEGDIVTVEKIEGATLYVTKRMKE
ncbi:MAG TPA: NfeD family protein [Oscillospiraceae bacterium]|nr:NfeD family protein [Oscillospiraceae bacterium]HQQ88659.1 NfeD family protein [Oscillospiraceae bacterium]HRW57904.1 NfeD family protein [Oscillospiraceae bacterium]